MKKKHNKYTYLHIVPQDGGGNFITRILKAFATDDYQTDIEQHIWVTNDKALFDKWVGKRNIIYTKRNMIFCINKYARYANWILIHGLSVSSPSLFLIKPWINKKIIWRTWGHDISLTNSDSGFSIKNKIRSFLTLLLKNRVKKYKAIGIANFIDEIKINLIFGNSVTYFTLPYSREKLEETRTIDLINSLSHNYQKKDSVFRIMIGHAADSGDNHIEILSRMKKYFDGNVLIYVMLPYGDSSYAAKVSLFVQQNFPDKAIVVDSPMSYGDYYNFILQMDLCVFDLAKSGAVGNIALCLRAGKSIALNKNGDIYKAFKIGGIPCITTDLLGVLSFDELIKRDDYDVTKACELFAPGILNPEYGVKQWNKLFTSLGSNNYFSDLN